MLNINAPLPVDAIVTQDRVHRRTLILVVLNRWILLPVDGIMSLDRVHALLLLMLNIWALLLTYGVVTQIHVHCRAVILIVLSPRVLLPESQFLCLLQAYKQGFWNAWNGYNSGGRSVGIVRLRTKTTEFSFLVFMKRLQLVILNQLAELQKRSDLINI
jgi:hypothetical protein